MIFETCTSVLMFNLSRKVALQTESVVSVHVETYFCHEFEEVGV